MTPDAIIVLSAGVKRNAAGQWTSTELNAQDNALGAPGGKIRILAAASLASQHPYAVVVATGQKGYDISSAATEDRPLLCEVLRDELLDAGVPEERIVLEDKSNTTYQQLGEIEKLASRRAWQNVALVTNRYHLGRLEAIMRVKFPTLARVAAPVSAEEVLLEADRERWEPVFAEAYSSKFMAQRVAQEQRGIAQIADGTYLFN